MDYSVRYDEEKKIILGKVYGEVNADLVTRMAAEISELIKEKKCCNVLNDLRDAVITKSIREIYSLPRIMSKVEVPIYCKRALLIREITTDFHFFETTSMNFGHLIRLFTDIDLAMKWLNEDDTNERV